MAVPRPWYYTTRSATVGVYGSLQRIAGKSLQEIAGLELTAIESPYGK